MAASVHDPPPRRAAGPAHVRLRPTAAPIRAGP
jgi:hypothetical protein